MLKSCLRFSENLEPENLCFLRWNCTGFLRIVERGDTQSGANRLTSFIKMELSFGGTREIGDAEIMRARDLLDECQFNPEDSQLVDIENLKGMAWLVALETDTVWELYQACDEVALVVYLMRWFPTKTDLLFGIRCVIMTGALPLGYCVTDWVPILPPSLAMTRLTHCVLHYTD